MKHLITVFSCICTFLITNSSSAQTCCTGGVPITGTFRVNPVPSKSLQLRITYDYNKIEDFYLQGDKLDDDYIKRATKTLIAQSDYGVSKNFSMSLVVPYVWANEEVNQLSQSLLSKTNGIGDISLIGQFRLPLDTKHQLIVGSGLKFPTGETKKIDKDDGFILPASLQPGTGSFDPILLIHYQTSFSFRKTLLITGSAFYKVNTTSQRLTFHEKYKFGNELQLFAGLSDQFVWGSVMNSPSVLLRLRNTQKDLVEDFSNDNTGGTWLYVVPGWNFNLSSNVILGISAELPIYRNPEGFQITTSNKLVASLYINFNKNDFDI